MSVARVGRPGAGVKRLQDRPGIERFEPDGVLFEDGSRRTLDAVVSATGFHCRLERFLEGAEQLVDERGYPRWHGREASLAGLYLVGYANPVSGALREIRLEAKRVAKRIAAGAPEGARSHRA